ncbi:MAG: M20/M25/M40 family metallo-hydrolase [Calditrichaeota bacterium]|nr:M20/M25/M40 family metallo-hydrolase [Calditrichota bacterium]MCB9368232.1 M20/M25/M40 family metallo-hydrolase [Calditrichota bacterium]
MSLPQVNRDRMVDLFCKLVSIDSPSKKEAPVADFIEKHLAPLGVKVWRDDAGEKIGGNCGNLHVRMDARGSKSPAVLFSSHMDTVMPGIGVKPKVDGDFIRSDGTTVLGADDKAGVTAILEMLQCIHESDMPHGPIEVIFDVAEEIGLMGANEVDLTQVKAKYAIVLDGEDMDQIIYKSPSANRMFYEIEGIAAHAGMRPENGISAIEVFCEAVSNMTLGRLDSETTANIGTIEAGRATNIVCEHLQSRAEARSHSTEKLEAQTAAMSKAFKDAIAKFERVIDGKPRRAVLKETVNREFTAMNIPLDSLVFKVVSEAGELIGLKMKPEAIGGGTNANVYNAKGLPAVVIGCGMKEEHTTSEHLAINDLVMAAKLCLAILQKNHEHSLA